eukprot:gb/GECG01000377.1/.p1 GENE.gb/GECG01000377.1/~~gb/GECG01000377.1/.p1  ORF type:complete len:118 (+),score=1.12 gb/GECG01000377.1/:1-354(+)
MLHPDGSTKNKQERVQSVLGVYYTVPGGGITEARLRVRIQSSQIVVRKQSYEVAFTCVHTQVLQRYDSLYVANPFSVNHSRESPPCPPHYSCWLVLVSYQTQFHSTALPVGAVQHRI